MYTDIKTILDDANKNNYAVLAASAFNMELARGLIAAADEMQAPLIILMGQAQMTKHARPAKMNMGMAIILNDLAPLAIRWTIISKGG